MHKDELRLRERAYRNGWIRERKLHMIWRAIARRHLSRVALRADWLAYDSDGETDP
jgi:hypothetical protein